MSRWIRRALLCIALGFATAWLVAWGLTVGMWAGWYRSTPTWLGEGTGVVEPWLLEKSADRRPGWETERWSGDRLDRENQISEHHRSKADRVLEIGGAAYAEENRLPLDEMDNAYTEFEAQWGWERGAVIKNYREMLAITQRIDDQVASFPPPYLAGRMPTMEADHFFLYALRVGWPLPMLESISGHEITFTGAGMQKTDVEETQITIHALKRAPVAGWPPQALSLPFGVIAPAAVTNTIFFAASWFALFTGFELFRSLRRRMAGRCVRCGYDLGRVVGKTCPECGRTKK